MTALKKYARLESPGLWRETPAAQLREVIVSFGEASLILSDVKTETPLTHWSLPAVERLNPGEMPALFSPGIEHTETIELDDTAMVEAIETVRGAIEARRPRPGRLRGAILAAGLAAGAALAVFWLPGAMITYTASVIPAATRAEIGRLALADLARVSGQPCTATLADRALSRLSDRLFGPGAVTLVVVPEAVPGALPLPGRLVVLNRRLIEDQDGPEPVAGHALAARARAEATDPMIALLTYVGLRATFGVLTSGTLDPAALRGYAEQALTAPPAPVGTDALLARFETARVSSAAYAYAVDPSGETVLPLIEGDPMRGAARVPILPDAEWVSLQGICTA